MVTQNFCQVATDGFHQVSGNLKYEFHGEQEAEFREDFYCRVIGVMGYLREKRKAELLCSWTGPPQMGYY